MIMTKQVESKESNFYIASSEKKKINIQNIIFPKLDICTVEELFFRGDDGVLFDYQNRTLGIKKDTVVSFNTYFNGFFANKWKSYTSITNIGVCLSLQGYFNIHIYSVDSFVQSRTIVMQKTVKNAHFDSPIVLENFDIYPYNGMIYIEVQALSNNCQMEGGFFYSYVQEIKDIRLGIVICTYKRETYVRKNIDLLEKNLLSRDEYRDKLKIFVIDNGKTLSSFDNPLIEIIPNKNAGGSGGFARGMIEVANHHRGFSHILLMDDDVLFDPEVILRLSNFLSVINQDDICVGGDMLRLDKKHIQHERGGYWNKLRGCTPVKYNLDLTVLENILFNEIEEYCEYNAWWLYCFPVDSIKKIGLPYPFFIRLDDVEFSKRINNKIIALNGICVWHEQFENKQSPVTEYYNIRNGLIFNSLYYEKNASIFSHLSWFLLPTIRHLFCYRYETAEYVLQAASDFLCGPENLFSQNPQQNHSKLSLCAEKTRRNKNGVSPFIMKKYMESINENENLLHRIWRVFTLNGHILPRSFFWDDRNLTDKGYKVVSSYGSKPLNVFRAKTIIYYNIETQESFAVQFSRTRFFRILFHSIYLGILMLLKYGRLAKLYKTTLGKFTSQSFWEEYLELKKQF